MCEAISPNNCLELQNELSKAKVKRSQDLTTVSSSAYRRNRTVFTIRTATFPGINCDPRTVRKDPGSLESHRGGRYFLFVFQSCSTRGGRRVDKKTEAQLHFLQWKLLLHLGAGASLLSGDEVYGNVNGRLHSFRRSEFCLNGCRRKCLWKLRKLPRKLRKLPCN